MSKLNFSEEIFSQNYKTYVASFSDFFDEKAKQNGLTNHAIRLYIRWFSKENEAIIKKYLKAEDFDPLVKNLNQILKEKDEERFANGTILVGSLGDLDPELLPKFNDCIPLLLEICKDKTGLWRKNAGILVAKLAKHPANLDIFRKFHGIEILSSVSQFILGNK